MPDPVTRATDIILTYNGASTLPGIVLRVGDDPGTWYVAVLGISEYATYQMEVHPTEGGAMAAYNGNGGGANPLNFQGWHLPDKRTSVVDVIQLVADNLTATALATQNKIAEEWGS